MNASPQTAQTSEARTSTSTILVVDDEPAFCLVVSEILQLDGHTVHYATRVQQALSMLNQASPQLILTDILMPEDDGIDLIRQLRANPRWSAIPIIVVSANAHPDQLAAATDAGADACLSKPFSAQDLRAAVGRYLPG